MNMNNRTRMIQIKRNRTRMIRMKLINTDYKSDPLNPSNQFYPCSIKTYSCSIQLLEAR